MENHSHSEPESPTPLSPSAPEPLASPEENVPPADPSPQDSPPPASEPPGAGMPSTPPESEPQEDQPADEASETGQEPLLTAAAEPAPEPGSIEDFAARCQKGRLSADEEAAAAAILSQILLGGRAEVARAIQVIQKLPWIITVQGTAAAWPEMKPSFRSQLLAGLAKAQSENAPRIRLSLARGLFKVDSAASLKLILLTLKVLRDKSSGLLAGKGAPLFANVLIGRGKAWLLQLPTEGLKPAELDLLVHAALHGAFHAPQAPITQLSILRWAAALGKLDALPAALDHMVSKGLSRWSAKWQASLRREVENLPPSWVAVFKPTPENDSHSTRAPRGRHSRNQDHRERSDARTDESHEPESDEAESEEDLECPPPRHASDSEASENHTTPGEESEDHSPDRSVPAPRSEESEDEDSEEEEDADEEDEDSEADEDEESDLPRRDSGRPRPVYVSKTVPGPTGGGYGAQAARRSGNHTHFNLQETLRQIEQYANGLRSELHSAQKQLRQREEDSRRNRRPERSAPLITGDPSAEELARLNLQLEARNAELAARIQELTTDSEDRAASLGLPTDSPVPDGNSQLRALLAFKLKEDFEDFKALEEAAKDLVVQQHYRSVLQHVFEVLQAEGVQFPPPETPAS
ncbi:MAG: hypothetical protein RLZZ244_828 [Verrucomicrobiota bacterium]